MKRTNNSITASKARLFTYTSVLAIIIITALSALPSFSQILNPGFESWTNGNPDNWKTSNSPPNLVNITQSSDAHGGSSAVQGTIKTVAGFAIPCVIISGTTEKGFSINERPEALHGWYKLTSVNGDLFQINVVYSKNGAGIGAATFGTSNSNSGYTEFIANSIWGSQDTPDTVYISAGITTGTQGQLHAGSTFLLDDLAFGPASASGVSNDISAVYTDFTLDQNYPNPVSQTTIINYYVPESSHVTLRVFDMLGQQVAIIADGYKSTGSYYAVFNSAGLPAGTYIYTLQAGTVSLVKQMEVVK